MTWHVKQHDQGVTRITDNQPQQANNSRIGGALGLERKKGPQARGGPVWGRSPMFHGKGHASTEVQTIQAAEATRSQSTSAAPAQHSAAHSPRGQRIRVHRRTASRRVAFRHGLILLALAVAMAF